jgi:hypothetical protein
VEGWTVRGVLSWLLWGLIFCSDVLIWNVLCITWWRWFIFVPFSLTYCTVDKQFGYTIFIALILGMLISLKAHLRSLRFNPYFSPTLLSFQIYWKLSWRYISGVRANNTEALYYCILSFCCISASVSVNNGLVGFTDLVILWNFINPPPICSTCQNTLPEESPLCFWGWIEKLYYSCMLKIWNMPRVKYAKGCHWNNTWILREIG